MHSFPPGTNLLHACFSTRPHAVLHSFSFCEVHAFAFHNLQTSAAAFLLLEVESFSFFFSVDFT